VEEAWFLLRDGELFHRVFQTLFDGRASVKTATLASSRRACLLPVFELAPRLTISGLMTGYGANSPRDYLSRFHLNADAFVKEVRECGFESLHQAINGQLDSARLLRLIEQPRVRAALIERSRIERPAFEEYLRQEGLFESNRIALVDIGWRGNIQKAIHLMLAQAARKPRLVGYYLGTTALFGEVMVPGLEFHSYLMHLGEPVHVARLLELFFVEIVCSCDSQSVLYFERKGGLIQGVFQAPDTSNEQSRLLAKVREGIMSFAENYRKHGLLLGLIEIPPFVAAENLLRLISNPTKREAVEFGGLSHCDNATSAKKRMLARFGPHTDLASLWNDYQNALWKPGLLAQPSEKAAALRTLLWMLQE
jgi:predicted HAD superfamily hydrolase